MICLIFPTSWASVPLMYLLVWLFKDVSAGYLSLFTLNLLIGIVTSACVFLLQLFVYIPVSNS